MPVSEKKITGDHFLYLAALWCVFSDPAVSERSSVETTAGGMAGSNGSFPRFNSL